MRLIELFDCAQVRGCVDANNIIDQACMQQSCPQELAACFGPPLQAMGIGNCADLLVCLNGCGGGDQQCALRCVGDASPRAFAFYNAALACIDFAGCPPNDIPCQRMRCNAEIEACLNN